MCSALMRRRVSRSDGGATRPRHPDLTRLRESNTNMSEPASSLDRRQRPSHRGERSAEELRARHPRIVIVHTPTYASWFNQIEIFFSIIQRKALMPNDYTSLDQLAESITAFGQRYSALEMPFNWRFTRHDLERRLRDPLLQPELIALATAA
jgi:transposase